MAVEATEVSRSSRSKTTPVELTGGRDGHAIVSSMSSGHRVLRIVQGVVYASGMYVTQN